MNTEATTPALAQEVAALRASVEMLVRMTAPRMTRDEVCARLRIHRNTLAHWVRERRFPAPGRDGNWGLADVMDWERSGAGQ